MDRGTNSQSKQRAIDFNVGIGTTGPVTTLDVNGTLNVSGRANFTGAALKNVLSCTETLETNAAGEIVCGTDVSGSDNDWTTSATAVYNDTSGVNVGVGTASPDHKLHVAGSMNVTQSGTSLRVTSNGDVVIRLG